MSREPDGGGTKHPWGIPGDAKSGGLFPYQTLLQDRTGWATTDYVHPAEYGQTVEKWDTLNAPQQQQQEAYIWTGPQQYGDKN